MNISLPVDKGAHANQIQFICTNFVRIENLKTLYQIFKIKCGNDFKKAIFKSRYS